MSARPALKTKWIELTTRKATRTIIKDHALLIIEDHLPDPNEFKLQFEEVMPPETIPYRDHKIHQMFALIRSLTTEFGVQVERRSALLVEREIAFNIFEEELQVISMKMIDYQERTTATAPSPFR